MRSNVRAQKSMYSIGLLVTRHNRDNHHRASRKKKLNL